MASHAYLRMGSHQPHETKGLKTMGNSTAHYSYPDVYRLLTKVYHSGERVTIEYPTAIEAIKFVSRCGSYRRLERKIAGVCAYDALRVSREGGLVTITHWDQTIGIVRDAAGELLDISDVTTPQESHEFFLYGEDKPKPALEPEKTNKDFLLDE
jgi:hypothetical protein